MALSSSLALIFISFSLSILAGHAYLPKHNNISQNVSAGFVKVATIFPSGGMQIWEGECFKHSNCYGIFQRDYAHLVLVADEAKNNTCHDSYEFKVRETAVDSQTYEAADPGIFHDVDFFFSKKLKRDIEDHGVSIYLYKKNWREDCDPKKESGFEFDIVKEDEETVETF